MPDNGRELTRGVRSKGFDEGTEDRRQVTRAARRLGSEGHIERGRRIPAADSSNAPSTFSDLLYRATRRKKLEPSQSAGQGLPDRQRSNQFVVPRVQPKKRSCGISADSRREFSQSKIAE
jgi:hypothetical protein